MKKIFFLIAFLPILLLFLNSCNTSGHKNLTASDSLLIYEAISKQAKIGDTVPQIEKFTFLSSFAPATILDPAVAREYHKNYIDNPIANLLNENNEKIRGFYITRSDVTDIYKSGIKGARIYLGYDGQKYRIMIAGVNNEGVNDLSKIVDDFFPCPDRCPDDDGTATEAIRKKIYESDLNYLRTEGNEVILKGFNSTEVRRRWQ
jgi:hypothetical protein